MPTILHGLISGTGVVFAVGRLIAWAVTAETEIFRAGIPDRPFAGFVREMKNGNTATLWQINQAKGLGFRQGDLALHGLNAGKSFQRRIASAWHGR